VVPRLRQSPPQKHLLDGRQRHTPRQHPFRSAFLFLLLSFCSSFCPFSPNSSHPLHSPLHHLRQLPDRLPLEHLPRRHLHPRFLPWPQLRLWRHCSAGLPPSPPAASAPVHLPAAPPPPAPPLHAPAAPLRSPPTPPGTPAPSPARPLSRQTPIALPHSTSPGL